MEHRLLGGAGWKVPVLALGTGTFGGTNEFFKGFGATEVKEATRLVDVCLEAWAIFVITAVAGSFATFFSSGDTS